ncbi:putative polysaccharide biosynthesis protein [[Ruminococcus] torques]|uniref:putative polysaccharide biosynthesis protein n=1 Tax=[Ruminococcus] torques TaxID=33039 RepID=UPI001F95C728|nr:polysaccharide biosynthesis protein [[Ruminococcus] torques]MBS5398620.1 polysaccharide biosynthesis protein [Lachnospiraceae bacterium]MDM8236423.1 polysaccharide biosynthesis protein [[Ruminococcus] torques]HJC80602.1 polysaccharide biosynthesis protein [Candidatus Mediterraneibacter excrementipullorum]
MADTRKTRMRSAQNDDFIAQGAILAVATVLTKVIGVIYRIPLANILGDAGNGFYGYAYQIYAMALMVSSLSLPTAVSKLVSAKLAAGQKRNSVRVFRCSMLFAVVVGAVITAAVFFGADAISVYAMKSPLSVYALQMLAPGLFLVAVMAVIRGYFQGLGSMMPTAVSQIIEQLIRAVISIAGASIFVDIGTRAGEKAGEELLGPAYGAAGATLGTVLGALIALVFLIFVIWAYRGQMTRQYRTDRSGREDSYRHILKVLVLTAVPILFSTAIYNINQILDLTIFNHIMDAQGYVEEEYMALQGIYSGKYDTLVNVPLSIPWALCSSVVPSLTAAVATRSRKLVHEKIDQTLRLTMVITIPCGVGFLVLASPLMVLLYNDASKTPAYLLMLGSVVVVLYGWSSISNSILHGLNHISSPAKNACIALVVHLAAFVVMMTAFKMNVYALAAGNIVFAACMCWLNQRKVHKVCGFRMNIMDTFIKPLIASAVMGIVTYAAHLALDLLIGGRWIPTIIAIFIAMIVYVVVVLKIGTLSDEDIEALPMGARLLRLCRRLHLMP